MASATLTGWISDSQCGVKAQTTKPRLHDQLRPGRHGASTWFVHDADKKCMLIISGQSGGAAGHHVTYKGTFGRRNAQLSQSSTWLLQASKSFQFFQDGRRFGAPVLFCAAKYFRYDVGAAMSTLLIHAGRALTPTTELTNAGI